MVWRRRHNGRSLKAPLRPTLGIVSENVALRPARGDDSVTAGTLRRRNSIQPYGLCEGPEWRFACSLVGTWKTKQGTGAAATWAHAPPGGKIGPIESSAGCTAC